MMDADVEVRCKCGVRGGHPRPGELRNGYRPREWDTRAGTIEPAIPRLRQRTYWSA
jgi:putative transposase